MSRLLLTLLLVLAFTAGVLGLKACSELRETRLEDTPIPRDIVVLANGLAVEAPNGSVAQSLVDWLEQPQKAHGVFHLGGVQFEGRSTVPTRATQHRMPALIKMLRAYPSVQARFIGFSSPSGNRFDDRAVALARARWAVDALLQAGIEPDRLSARAAVERERHAAAASLPDRVDLELSKQ